MSPNDGGGGDAASEGGRGKGEEKAVLAKNKAAPEFITAVESEPDEARAPLRQSVFPPAAAARA